MAKLKNQSEVDIFMHGYREGTAGAYQIILSVIEGLDDPEAIKRVVKNGEKVALEQMKRSNQE